MEGTILNSNRNPRDNRDLSETPWCQADWKVTFNMPTTFPLCLTRKKTKRPTEKGCAPPTDEPNCYICLRFFDVVLRHFFCGWVSCLLCGGLQSYMCLHFFYAVGVPLAKAQKPGLYACIAFLRPKQVETRVQSVGASPVGKVSRQPCLQNSQLLVHQSIRGVKSPQSNQTCWPRHRCLQHKGWIVAEKDR